MASIKTTDTSSVWSPDQVSTFKLEDALPENLLTQITTRVGEVRGEAPAIRIPVIGDADDAGWVNEAAQIPETDVDLTEELLYVNKLAQIVSLSNEQNGQVDTPAVVANSVRRNLTRKINRALLTQTAPTAPAQSPAAGLFVTTGVIAGDAVSTSTDPLVDAIVEIQANGGAPKAIVCDPLAFGVLAKFKQSEGSNVGLLSAPNAALNFQVLGLPLIVSEFAPANKGMIVSQDAVVSAYGDIEVAQSIDAKFTSDEIVHRALIHLGWKVVRANQLAVFDVTDEVTA